MELTAKQIIIIAMYIHSAYWEGSCSGSEMPGCEHDWFDNGEVRNKFIGYALKVLGEIGLIEMPSDKYDIDILVDMSQLDKWALIK